MTKKLKHYGPWRVKSNLRHFLLKQGLIKPKGLMEFASYQRTPISGQVTGSLTQEDVLYKFKRMTPDAVSVDPRNVVSDELFGKMTEEEVFELRIYASSGMMCGDGTMLMGVESYNILQDYISKMKKKYV